MAEKSWLDSPETARQYLFELIQHPWTDQDNLEAINELRAMSGDRPLSMERYLENEENLKVESTQIALKPHGSSISASKLSKQASCGIAQ